LSRAALVDGEAHVVAVEALGQLVLAASRFLRLRVVDVVADFGGVNDLAAPIAKRFSQLALATSVAVGIGGVEEVDPVQRLRRAQHLHRLLVGFLSPPTGREGPRSESNFADGEGGARENPVAHYEI